MQLTARMTALLASFAGAQAGQPMSALFFNSGARNGGWNGRGDYPTSFDSAARKEISSMKKKEDKVDLVAPQGADTWVLHSTSDGNWHDGVHAKIAPLGDVLIYGETACENAGPGLDGEANSKVLGLFHHDGAPIGLIVGDTNIGLQSSCKALVAASVKANGNLADSCCCCIVMLLLLVVIAAGVVVVVCCCCKKKDDDYDSSDNL